MGAAYSRFMTSGLIQNGMMMRSIELRGLGR